MPTATSFSVSQKQAAQQYWDAGDIPGMYRYLADQVTAGGGDPKLANWLSTAADINAGSGFYADFVRGAMYEAGRQNGVPINASTFQTVSNLLAQTVLDDVVNGGALSFNEVIASDVRAAVTQFGLPPDYWAGSIGAMFPVGIGGLGLDPATASYYRQVSAYYEEHGYLPLDLALRFLDLLKMNMAGALEGMDQVSWDEASDSLDPTSIEAWGNLLDRLKDGMHGAGNVWNFWLKDLFDFSEYFDKLKSKFQDLFETLKDGTFRIVRYYDPLALDLNGDGTITTIADGNLSGPLFDFDNDGYRTATGWVSGGDGLLVRDLNGNGSIDSGTELFGDQTVLRSGAIASDGYQALADLDENADGVVDANDAAFASLRIWRDDNADGVTDAGELLTLQALGIASLAVAHTTENTAVTGGQRVATGSFTRVNADGSTSTGVMQEFDFDADTIHGDYVTDVVIPETLSDIVVDLPGIGRLRPLLEACVLSPALAGLVRQFAAATTAADQKALMPDLLMAWARTSPGFSEDTVKVYATGYIEDPNSENVIINPADTFLPLPTDLDSDRSKNIRIAAAILGLPDNAVDIIGWANENVPIYEQIYINFFDSVYEQLALQSRLKGYLEAIQIGISADFTALTFDFSGVEAMILARAAIDPYNAFTDLLELNKYKGEFFASNGWAIGSVATQFLNSAEFTNDQLLTLRGDLGILVATDTTAVSGSTPAEIMLGNANDNSINGLGGDDLIFGYGGNDVLSGDAGNDSLFGGTGDDTLSGGSGTDKLFGQAGNDTLNGGDDNDELYGDAGNDALNGGSGGSNKLYGGAGDDVLTMDAIGVGTGLNILAGGTGNDTLNGGGGADRYEFNLGDGQDTIVEQVYYGGMTDVLAFGAGIAAADIQVFREGNDLVLRHLNGTDSVRIKNQFNDTTWVTNSQLEKILFADGTEWTMATLQAAGVRTQGGTANETLGGYAGKDIMRGGDGNDTLSGGDSDDELYGDAGNDILNGGTGGSNKLYGGAGDDVLTLDSNGAATGLNILAGGVGNDTLNGGGGADRYEFNMGDGADTIVERVYYGGMIDVLAFGAGISASDIQVFREGNDLVLRHLNGTDSVRIKNQFDGATWVVNSQVERVVFADGTEWTPATMQGFGILMRGGEGNDTLSGFNSIDLIYGGDGNDTLTGGNGNDELYGDAGNDTLDGGTGGYNKLYGGAGADVLKVDQYGSSTGLNILAGGTGNDVLFGGGGADRYEFNLGDGQDAIVERVYYGGMTDVLAFGAGIAASDIKAYRVGNDLVLRHANGMDAVWVKDQFSGTTWVTNSQLEKILFADGTEWTMATLQAAGVTTQGGAGDEALGGYTGKDIMRGGDGNDTLSGGDSNDELYGDAGNDTLDGGTGGSNKLYGGAGADVLKVDQYGSSTGLNILAGGTGNDVLIGGGGADRYEFNLGDSQDTIVEQVYYGGMTDVLAFGAGIDADELWLTRTGNDLVISIIGTEDKVTIQNWFTGSQYQVEQMRLSNGQVLTASEANSLVNAMASYAPPSGTTLPDSYRTGLGSTIAAHW